MFTLEEDLDQVDDPGSVISYYRFVSLLELLTWPK